MRQLIDEWSERLDLRSLAQFASYVGLPRTTVSRYYNGHQLPNPETAALIAAKLGISPDAVPQYDPAGTSVKDAVILGLEVERLRARVDELEAELRRFEERQPATKTRAKVGRSRQAAAASGRKEK